MVTYSSCSTWNKHSCTNIAVYGLDAGLVKNYRKVAHLHWINRQVINLCLVKLNSSVCPLLIPSKISRKRFHGLWLCFTLIDNLCAVSCIRDISHSWYPSCDSIDDLQLDLVCTHWCTTVTLYSNINATWLTTSILCVLCVRTVGVELCSVTVMQNNRNWSFLSSDWTDPVVSLSHWEIHLKDWKITYCNHQIRISF